MADIIELRGPGNNGNELITVERDGDTISVYRDGVLAGIDDVREILDEAGVRSLRFRVRRAILDAFVTGATAEDFATGVAVEGEAEPDVG